jgi:hypothetical protein
MVRRPTRRAVTIVTVAAMLLAVVGFAAANVALLNNTQTAQGNYLKNSGSVPGIADRAIQYVNVPNPAPAVASTNRLALTVLTMGGGGHVSRYCAAACTAGHFSEEFQFTITAQVAAEGFMMNLSAIAGAHSLSTTLYFHIPATAPGATTTTLDIWVDLTAVSTNASATAALQQCSTATTCP